MCLVSLDFSKNAKRELFDRVGICCGWRIAVKAKISNSKRHRITCEFCSVSKTLQSKYTSLQWVVASSPCMSQKHFFEQIRQISLTLLSAWTEHFSRTISQLMHGYIIFHRTCALVLFISSVHCIHDVRSLSMDGQLKPIYGLDDFHEIVFFPVHFSLCGALRVVHWFILYLLRVIQPYARTDFVPPAISFCQLSVSCKWTNSLLALNGHCFQFDCLWQEGISSFNAFFFCEFYYKYIDEHAYTEIVFCQEFAKIGMCLFSK